MSLEKAVEAARYRQFIVPRGNSSMPRVSAVLTDGRITFEGNNSYRSHPLVKKFSKNPEKISVCAEVDALIQARLYFTSKLGVKRDSYVDLSGFHMYVARVLADGSVALARPCATCEDAMRWFKVSSVEWTENPTKD